MRTETPLGGKVKPTTERAGSRDLATMDNVADEVREMMMMMMMSNSVP